MSDSVALRDLAEQFVFLDELREEGSVNMFGARPIVAGEFGLTLEDAGRVLSSWMNTFSAEPAEVRAEKALASRPERKQHGNVTTTETK